MRPGPSSGPEGNLKILPRPSTRNLTWVPPTSMTRIRRGTRRPGAVRFPGIGRFCGATDARVNHRPPARIYTASGARSPRKMEGITMARPHRGAVALTVLVLCVAGTARAADGDHISTVMGSITVNAGEHRGDLATVNGSIRVGESAVVEEARTVNGSVTLEARATASEVKTVNGSVHLNDGAQVTGLVHTVNGSLSLAKSANVTRGLANVNGGIRIDAAHVGGDVETVNGGIEIGPDAHVDGGVIIHKDHSDHGDDTRSTPPRVVMGPGSVVKGPLRFERPVELYVSDRATIGTVEGATPVKFAGDRPPG